MSSIQIELWVNNSVTNYKTTHVFQGVKIGNSAVLLVLFTPYDIIE